jgi:PAS domain S-box-containing protein
MRDEDKTKEQLLAELHYLRERVTKLEKDRAESPNGQSLAWAQLYRFYIILSSLHSAILLVNEEGHVEFANQAFCDLFELNESPEALGGLSPSEMIQKIRDVYADPVGAVHCIEEIVRMGGAVTGEEVALQNGRTCLRDFIPIYVNGKRYGRLWHHQDITERKRAEETLRESRQRFQSIFNSMGEMVALHELVYDPDGHPVDYRILECNPAFSRVTGIPGNRAVGALASEVYGTGQPPYLERYSHVAMTGEREQFEAYFAPMQRHFQISVASPKPGHFVTVSTDITESVQQKQEIKLLNRLYSVLSQVSQAVVRATAAESFLEESCLVIVEEGGFLLSWIGFVEASTNRVVPSTLCGEAGDYARNIIVYSDDRPEGRGPTGTCIRERRPVVYNDFQKDPLSKPWRARASVFGINSVAAFPIVFQGEVCGALTIYSDSVGFFGEKDVKLLERVAGNIGFALDNLERKRQREEAELALKTSEENFRNLFENAPVGIFRTNSRGQALSVNTAMARILGLNSPQEALERYSNLGSQLYVHAERRDQFVNLLRRQAHVENFEYEAWAVDGRKIWLSMNARVKSCDDDGVMLIEGFTTDITERKQAEVMLRKSEEKYRLLTEQSLQGIAILRGIPPVFVYVNPRWTEIFGYTAEEVLSFGPEAMWNLVHPDDRSMVRQRHRDRLMGLQVVSKYEFRIVCKDGSVRWVEVFGSAITSVDDPMTQAVYVDITDRKQVEAEKEGLETQLRQAQKLEAIGTLAGGIAHDFNNILAPIIGYTEMVLSDLPESTSARNDLEQVLSAAHRARELVKQILAFSRHGQDQKRIPVDLRPIVKEVLKLMRASLPTSIEIRESIQSRTALADATQIHQVLVNLCTNASHAMDESGVLSVTLSGIVMSEGDLARLAIADLKPGHYLKLRVADTGKGMDNDTLRRIFDPYFTTREVGKGTGLGLAVVHGIIKRHEGAISVSSELGKGTVFDVYLPSADPQLERVGQISHDLPRGSERILFVDDEPMVAELGGRLLKQLGYEVVSKTKVLDALATFHRSPHDFDLIVTDYTMPGMTGTELAGEVLKIRPDMPVILCTGYSEKGTESSARELGIKGYALKPLDRKQLAELVRRVLDEGKR